VCGNVDAGKSTCIGVMKTGMLDDGRGSARTTTMIHSHEIESGRTSTVSHHVIGFKTDGRITNYEQGSRQPSVDMITQQSVRLLTFIDLAGHEKYLRSMIYGVSSCLLDYSLVLINARSGVTHMTHHHLTVCCMMNIPILILFTKVDACPAHRYKQTVDETRELLKAPDVRKRLMLINTSQAKGGDAENAVARGGGNGAGAPGTDKYGGEISAASTPSTPAAAGGTENSSKPKDSKTGQNEDKDNQTATEAAVALHSVLSCLTATRQVAIPAFPVSFTEGTNLEFLRRLCRFLPKRRRHADKKLESLEYIVDRIYSVPGTHVCTSVRLYVCMHACLYVCTSVRLYACMPECTHVCMSVCLYACMPVCMHVCMSVCMFACRSVGLYVCKSSAYRAYNVCTAFIFLPWDRIPTLIISLTLTSFLPALLVMESLI